MRSAALAPLAALLLGSCGWIMPEPVVTAAQLVQGAREVSQNLRGAQRVSEDAATTVEDAYKDLGTFLREKNMTDQRLTRMEATMARLREKGDGLKKSLDGTKKSARDLFELMETRAKQNQTESLRDRLMKDIKAKRKSFDDQMGSAEDGMDKIRASIQKYDDILGFVQVNRGLQGIDQYMGEISKVIAEGEALNAEIQKAIEAGMQIVDPRQFGS
jgi:chromosome segregation ATPase